MSLTKKAIGGSIHRIREFELEKVNLAEEFDILQIVGEGWFGKILLTEHKSTQTEMALKALPKAYTAITDFYREFHYGLHLSAHRNIITTYDVAFETAGFYVFSQEYAPLGDLTSNVTETGLGELHTKKVARQLAAAIHHIHSRELVHRDIKLDNILVFKSDFSRIKLCDFGETRRINTIVRRHNEWLPYSPPEVLHIDPDDTYKALTAHDVWQFGIVLFVCLTGCLPWQKAAMDDKRYTRYLNWHSATLNIAKKPKLFQLISSRAQRMFKRLLEPKLDKRPVSVLEANKYLEDRWLGKLGAEKSMNGGVDERDELCPSMYSFHSSPEEKNQLLYTLTRYGIETTVDRSRKKDRIREWIQSSAITEENEDEDDFVVDTNNTVNENDTDENGSMKGRHFPERRPSVKASASPERPITSDKIRVRRTTSDKITSGNNHQNESKRRSTSTHRPSLRNLERRNPFAPQVAEEMQTIARFANFPNGDPNLAISPVGIMKTDNLVAQSTVPQIAPFSAQAPNADSNERVSQVSEIKLLDPAFDSEGNREVINNINNNNNSNNNNNVTIMPINSAGWEETQTIETMNKNLLQNGDAMSYLQSAPKSPQVPTRKNRDHKVQFSTMINQVPATDFLSNRRSNEINNKLTNQLPLNPNPLTMSVASQLVMQSFHMIQGINSMQSTPLSGSGTSSSGSVYGKDAYEHYGVAQGTVMVKPEITRNGRSSGSGSRSVSS
ncbi:probable serine/threonine-protein kinase DDB_G0268876 [Microplitis demolitor]|uniref:probable serine/threonine-protein kinase DDB_G0268876 n=1 Tax=Microplitis demolitor TaxID=69319 RepID=UPI0004CD54A4|nr:probable serine/threonine-protein kinase DDB_G0268876 [Microplitis demolitor]XP_053595123.1 probable serine/threonine-protein kinase DDB_G0268876 [Microplitis demolitor]